jgi:hypothetical protein
MTADAYGRTIDPRDAGYIRRANAALSANHARGKHQQTASHGCPEAECIERYQAAMQAQAARLVACVNRHCTLGRDHDGAHVDRYGQRWEPAR